MARNDNKPQICQIFARVMALYNYVLSVYCLLIIVHIFPNLCPIPNRLNSVGSKFSVCTSSLWSINREADGRQPGLMTSDHYTHLQDNSRRWFSGKTQYLLSALANHWTALHLWLTACFYVRISLKGPIQSSENTKLMVQHDQLTGSICLH